MEGGEGSFAARKRSIMKKRKSIHKDIARMVDRIVARFNPELIILFGSHARCDGGTDSDVDLLVVLPVDGDKRRKRLEIRGILRDIRIPKDIIVTTAKEFEWRKEIVGAIERPALLEEKVLYEKKERANTATG
jgi:predicted nucleotidyltransferase